MFAEIFDSKSSLLATTATILLTVWSASKGTMAIGRGLTFMAGKEDSVNYFLRRAINTLYTLIFCVMLVAVMVIYILGDVVVSKMLVRLDSVERFQLVDTVANILSIVKIAFAPTVLFGVMIVAYWALPVERVRIKTAVPGAAATEDSVVAADSSEGTDGILLGRGRGDAAAADFFREYVFCIVDLRRTD